MQISSLKQTIPSYQVDPPPRNQGADHGTMTAVGIAATAGCRGCPGDAPFGSLDRWFQRWVSGPWFPDRCSNDFHVSRRLVTQQIPTVRYPSRSHVLICSVHPIYDSLHDTLGLPGTMVDHPVAFHIFFQQNRGGSLEKLSTAMRSGDFDDPWPCGVAPSRRR